MNEEFSDVREKDDAATCLVDPEEEGAATVAAESAATRDIASEEDEAATVIADQEMTLESEIPASTALDQLELPLEVRLGRLTRDLERVLSLQVGDAVPVGPDRDDLVTLYVQGRPYAVGDLVVVEGNPLQLEGLRDRVVAVYQRGDLVSGTVPP